MAENKRVFLGLKNNLELFHPIYDDRRGPTL